MDFHGFSWISHGFPMDFPWIFHGFPMISMDFPWISPGFSHGKTCQFSRSLPGLHGLHALPEAAGPGIGDALGAAAAPARVAEPGAGLDAWNRNGILVGYLYCDPVNMCIYECEYCI